MHKTQKNIYLLFIIFIIFTTNPVFATRRSARDKACFSNSRVLMGAIEMYNMDNSNDITSFNEVGILDNSHLKPTTKMNGYFKEMYLPDSSCKYDYDPSKQLVYCHYHGSPGFYYETYIRNNDPNIIPPDPQYLEEYERKFKKQQFQKTFGWMIPFGVVSTILLGIWVMFGSTKKKKVS